MATYKKVMNRLDSYTPLGYSLCGVVTEVGAGRRGVQGRPAGRGAGNEYALHAEYNWVPVNLCVAVPDGVAAEHAAFATVGAIAMQGVRRAERAARRDRAASSASAWSASWWSGCWSRPGCGWSALDLIEDRCRLAEKAGAVACAAPDDEGLAAVAAALAELTGGPRRRPRVPGRGRLLQRAGRDRGQAGPGPGPGRRHRQDASWTCPGTPTTTRSSTSGSPGPTGRAATTTGTSSTASTTRPATSAGPSGATWSASSTWSPERARGGDRWSRVRSRWTDAAQVYGDLTSGALKAVGVLLEYPAPDRRGPAPARPPAWCQHRAGAGRRRRRPDQAPGGSRSASSARATTPPRCCCRTWSSCTTPSLAHVATTRSLSAVNAQRKFGFATASTDARRRARGRVAGRDLHRDPARHARGAGLPGAGDRQGGVRREAARADPRGARPASPTSSHKTGNDRLMVGFNRRFAPLLAGRCARTSARRGSQSTRYLVNAGPLGRGQLVPQRGAEGSRFTGEGGHFIDTLSWWADSLPEEVYAVARRPEPDDVQVTIRFANGAVGTIAYLTGGNARLPEGDDRRHRRRAHRPARQLQDGHRLVRARPRPRPNARGGQDKGQRAEMAAFVDAVRTGAADADRVRVAGRPPPGPRSRCGESLLSGKPERV